jgi:hypothetical protein
MTEAEFVKEVDGLLPPPAYFGMNVAMNKSGIESFETVFNQGMKAIKATDFEVVAEETGALILDTRNNGDFAKIYSTINKHWYRWRFCSVGWCFNWRCQTTYFISNRFRFRRRNSNTFNSCGFDNVIGHLKMAFKLGSRRI